MALDLRLGNPYFVQPYWDALPAPAFEIKASKGIVYEKDGGQAGLIDTIRQLHAVLGNAVTEGRRIIIGNGATNILYAAVHGYKSVSFREPYYFKFPDIVRQAGATVLKGPEAEAEIVVQPHNPLNTILPPLGAPHQIYDYCYNWPQYGDVFLGDQDIMVFNLSKSTGHAASRIGWAICKNDSDAERIKNAIEFTSGGVSTEAQARATDILKQQLELIKTGQDIFSWSKQELHSRWNKLLAVNNPKLKVLNTSGMFAWCEYGDPARPASVQFEEDFGILTVSGSGCGGTAANLRINVGCKAEDFEFLISKLGLIG